MTERGLQGEALEFDTARVLILGRESFCRIDVCVVMGCGWANDADDIEACAKVL